MGRITLVFVAAWVMAGCAASPLRDAGRAVPRASVSSGLERAPVDGAEALPTAPPPAAEQTWVCPPIARFRPSEAWGFIERWRTRPLATELAERCRAYCLGRARKKSLAITAAAPLGIVG